MSRQELKVYAKQDEIRDTVRVLEKHRLYTAKINGPVILSYKTGRIFAGGKVYPNGIAVIRSSEGVEKYVPLDPSPKKTEIIMHKPAEETLHMVYSSQSEDANLSPREKVLQAVSRARNKQKVL